jgi:hypothetical protein
MLNPLVSKMFPGLQDGVGPAGQALQRSPVASLTPVTDPLTPGVEPTLMERARMAALNELAALQNPKPQQASKSNTLLTGFERVV